MDRGWCAPYADDYHPLLGHRSTKILSEESGAWETGRTIQPGIGGNAGLAALVLVRAIIATASTSKLTPSLNNLRQSLSSPHLESTVHPLACLTDLSYEVGTQCRIQ